MDIEELCVLINALASKESFAVNSYVKGNNLKAGTITGCCGTTIKYVVDKDGNCKFLVTNTTNTSCYKDATNSLKILQLGTIVEVNGDDGDSYYR